MTSATAHDYTWIRSSPLFRHALETGYTLTLVRGVAPGDVLRVMEAEPQGTCTGVDALIERQEELLDATAITPEVPRVYSIYSHHLTTCRGPGGPAVYE